MSSWDAMLPAPPMEPVPESGQVARLLASAGLPAESSIRGNVAVCACPWLPCCSRACGCRPVPSQYRTVPRRKRKRQRPSPDTMHPPAVRMCGLHRLIRPPLADFGPGIVRHPPPVALPRDSQARATHSSPGPWDLCPATPTLHLGTVPPHGTPEDGAGSVAGRPLLRLMDTRVGTCSGPSANLPAPRRPWPLSTVSPATVTTNRVGIHDRIAGCTGTGYPESTLLNGKQANPWPGPGLCRQGFRERPACSLEGGLSQSTPGGITPAVCRLTTLSPAGGETTTAACRCRTGGLSPLAPEVNMPVAYGPTTPSNAGGGTITARQRHQADGLSRSAPGSTTPVACGPTTPSNAGAGTSTAKQPRRVEDTSPSAPELSTPAVYRPTTPSSAGGKTITARQHHRPNGSSPSVPEVNIPAACGPKARSSAGVRMGPVG